MKSVEGEEDYDDEKVGEEHRKNDPSVKVNHLAPQLPEGLTFHRYAQAGRWNRIDTS